MDEERGKILKRAGALPVAWLAVIGAVVVAVAAFAGYYAYRTYDYVQHDNDFCMSCHLMAEPFERFARSEHRGLGCKACHQPTLVARSQMALTQVLEQPGEIATHAEVPSDVCAACHIDGDPERWRMIANSVGHRIHLESDDPGLRGLQCVECHSTSVHEFAATDRTCSQAECHQDQEIHLGRMGDFTIHCGACHGFRAPVAPDADPSVVAAGLRPDQGECLSCHVMRSLVDLPPDDPHNGVCADCHNPHEQVEASQAAESCATARCHSDVEAASDFHRGLSPTILQDCLSCHSAHDFRIDGSDCRSCHVDIFRGEVVLPGRTTAADRVEEPGFPEAHGPPASASSSSAPWGTVRLAALGDPGLAGGAWRHPGGAAGAVGVPGGALPALQAIDTVVFRHENHQDVDCLSCHATDGSHGRITVTTAMDCRRCHHAEPLAADCSNCHTTSDAFRSQAYSLTRTLERSVGGNVERALPFSHGVHAAEACASCHTGSVTLDASNVDCASCHEDHHQGTARCASCHVPAPFEEHPVSKVHVGCTGAGCHDAVPFQGIQRTRNFCVTCHQDMENHRAGEGPCIECHALPSLRGEVQEASIDWGTPPSLLTHPWIASTVEVGGLP